LRRGFKAQAERLAAAARAELGLSSRSALCPWEFAEHRGIAVWAPEDLGLDPDDLHHLTRVEPDSWSGLTVRHGELVGVVLNSAHPRSRQTNTLMHEIAHVDLRHVPSRVEMADGLLFLSDYPQDLEDEANWLAGAMLLPRDALVFHRNRGSSVIEIAEHFGVSDELCTWRLRMTGVDRQLGVGRRSPFQ
jgi:hypothetical protein